MPDITPSKDRSQAAHLPPPGGDSTKAEKYISQLIKLINQNKLLVDHTDLTQFDPSAIEDHYRMELKQYHVEISHSKQPETSQDFYIMLFTNLQDIRDGCSEKIILAYMHLTQTQFQRFKTTADEQVEKRRKEEEEKRFSEVMAPVDEALQKVENQDTLEEDLKEISQEPAPQVQEDTHPAIDVSEIPTAPAGETAPEPAMEIDHLPQEPEAPANTQTTNVTGSNLDQKGVADLLNDYQNHYSAQPADAPAPQPTFTPAYSPPPAAEPAPASSPFSSSFPTPSSPNLFANPPVPTVSPAATLADSGPAVDSTSAPATPPWASAFPESPQPTSTPASSSTPQY